MWSLPGVSSLAFPRSFLQRPGNMRLSLLGEVSMSLPNDLWEVSKCRGRVGACRHTEAFSFPSHGDVVPLVQVKVKMCT